ncbi:MAG: c-type cytochrome, partial [Burkholderiaceae bacterium]|nr:c-type cytochrome [Burkholderiaceae bacterium]
ASGRPASNTPRLSRQHAAVIIKQVLDIRSGLRHNPPMQPMVTEEELSLQTLADIAAYLQSLPVTGKLAKGPGSGVARGKEVFDNACSGCHGAGGEGTQAIFAPMVAAQHYPYLLRELEFIRDGKRGNSNPAMSSLIKAYTQDDLQAVADYMAQLPAPERP